MRWASGFAKLTMAGTLYPLVCIPGPYRPLATALTFSTSRSNDARRAIDERRSLVRLMGQQGEDTEDAHRLLGHLQHSLNDMIEFRDQVLRELERTGG